MSSRLQNFSFHLQHTCRQHLTCWYLFLFNYPLWNPPFVKFSPLKMINTPNFSDLIKQSRPTIFFRKIIWYIFIIQIFPHSCGENQILGIKHFCLFLANIKKTIWYIKIFPHSCGERWTKKIKFWKSSICVSFWRT